MSECVKAESAKLAAHRGELAKATTQQQVQLIHTRMRADLIAFAKRSGLTHCDLIEKICDIDKKKDGLQSIPTAPHVTPVNPDGPLGEGGVSASAVFQTGSSAPDELSVLYGRVIADCACNALLVPCPPCCDDSGYVLLACLKVVKGKVVDICNTVRTQLITGPSVRYWTQPLFDGIGRFFESMCCPQPAAAATSTDDAGASFNQFERATRLASAYGSSFARSSTSAIHGARTLELLQRPLAEVQLLLSHLSIRSTITRAATVEDAYSFDNLRDFSFEIPFNALVELIVAPDDTVAAIRTVRSATS
jgi:hypothetical protein